MGMPFGFVNSVDVINLIAVTDGNDTPRPSERATRKPEPSVIPLDTLSGVPSAPAIHKPGPSVSSLNTLSGVPSVPATQKPGPSADPLEILLGAPSAPAAQKPGPSVASLGTISGAPSARAVQNSGVSVTCLNTLSCAMSRPPGLSAALDSLGFEPEESVQIPISHVGVQFILLQISANCIIVTRLCVRRRPFQFPCRNHPLLLVHCKNAMINRSCPLENKRLTSTMGKCRVTSTIMSPCILMGGFQATLWTSSTRAFSKSLKYSARLGKVGECPGNRSRTVTTANTHAQMLKICGTFIQHISRRTCKQNLLGSLATSKFRELPLWRSGRSVIHSSNKTIPNTSTSWRHGRSPRSS